ncbi:hypothetical protein ACFL1X_14425 [Candidatus Hydrogenedentota bacterium]
MAEERCPKKFQVWIAFVLGLVFMVVAVGLFDRFAAQARVGDGLSGLGSVAQGIAGRPSAAPPWIGIDAMDVDAVTASQLGLDEAKGVLVTKVFY